MSAVTQSQQVPSCGWRCPAWCDGDHEPDAPYIHRGAVQCWSNGDEEGNDLRVEVSLYRGDDCLYPHLSGDTAIDLYFSGDDSMIDITDEGRPELSGFVMPDELRSLARWLLAVAEQADPHHRNGKPWGAA